MHLNWFHIVSAGILATAEILTILHILLTMRDDSERAALWLILVILLPAAGMILYLVTGISRLNTFGKRITLSVDRFLRERSEAEHHALRSRKEMMRQFRCTEPRNGVVGDFTAMLERLLQRNHQYFHQERNETPEDSPLLPLGASSLSGNKVELFCDGTDA